MEYELFYTFNSNFLRSSFKFNTKKKSDNNSLQFNSWLISDNEIKFALEAQMANRLLPYDMGVYLTRSKGNPLTATCYKEKFINEIYKKNKLKIIYIIKGTWRGSELPN